MAAATMSAAEQGSGGGDRLGRPGEGGQLPGAWVWCEEEGAWGLGVANYHSTLPPLKLINYLFIFGETPRGTTNHCKRPHKNIMCVFRMS